MSPSSASLTLILHSLSRRSAKALVNAAGMCWISTIGAGKLAGNWVRTRCRATGPPVEVPMATSLYGLRLGAGDVLAAAALVRTGAAARGAGVLPRLLTLGCAAGAGAGVGAGLA
ncbi:hypothetical protein D3C81_1515660 [compost metagenome]